jgi:hypothetical protein
LAAAMYLGVARGGEERGRRREWVWVGEDLILVPFQTGAD